MGSDRDAIRELLAVSCRESPHWLYHYLYFHDEATAANVNKLLHDKNFESEYRIGADGTSWLVLARHRLVLTEDSISRFRELLEQIAAENQGDYDGWEAQVEDKR
jgi:hypothetical protein